MDRKLTPKQKAFADYYIETGNATESYIKDGYNKKGARGNAARLIANDSIKQYIEERLAKIEDARIAKGEEVLQYLTKVMREEKDQFGLDPSLQDRTKAAELLGKRYRLFVDKVEQKVDATVNSTAKLDSILNQLGDEEE